MGAESWKKGHAGCNLIRLMEEHGVIQTRLAEATSMSSSYIHRVANGFTYPTVPNVLRILDALEYLTGRKFDVREVWALADEKRRHPRTHRVA